MILRKAKTLCLPVVCCMALALVFFQVPAKCYGFEITIDVAPNVLNLQRTDDKCVTVHTDISCSSVDCASVTLKAGEVSIKPYLCKCDDRGYFVAKFQMYDVRELELTTDEYNTFTLIGKDVYGEEFSGTQDILVVDNVPKGR